MVIFHRSEIDPAIRHYYPVDRPWIVDGAPDGNWHVFATRDEAEAYIEQQ